jgi:3-hydroxyisobutyrate dehydrogenase-like beta-hydroxyacid dehydrogenase
VFAEAIGLEAEKSLEVLMGSMAHSRIMDTKGRKMVEGDFSTQAKLTQHLKDVQLILEAASSAALVLPLTEAHRGLLQAAEEAGYGDADNSAVIRGFDRVIRKGAPAK